MSNPGKITVRRIPSVLRLIDVTYFISLSVLAMWTVRASRRNVPRMFGRSIATACASREESRAVYPPILDLKPEPTLARQELENHEKIRNLGTIEEKTIGVNMPR